MIDTAYIIESADYRIYEACPEILTPDRKPYKPVLRIRYKKPKVYEKSCRKRILPCERQSRRSVQNSICEIDRAARELGMSYGRYQELKGSETNGSI